MSQKKNPSVRSKDRESNTAYTKPNLKWESCSALATFIRSPTQIEKWTNCANAVKTLNFYWYQWLFIAVSTALTSRKSGLYLVVRTIFSFQFDKEFQLKA